MYKEQEVEVTPSQNKKGYKINKKIISALLFIAILVGGGYVLTQKSARFRSIIGVKPKTEQEAVSRYLAQLSHLMVLPVDDTPVLATVEDPEALIKQQAFFEGSQKGDVVLIFPKTSRAVLFSPKRNLILNAGPVIQNKDAPGDQKISQ